MKNRAERFTPILVGFLGISRAKIPVATYWNRETYLLNICIYLTQETTFVHDSRNLPFPSLTQYIEYIWHKKRDLIS